MLSVMIEKRLGNFLLKTDFETEEPITGLLGASGCGKSLTLKCIAGLEQPDRGRILLDGVVLFDSDAGICLPPQKRQVGYLFQSCALFPHMTVKQNILCGMQKETAGKPLPAQPPSPPGICDGFKARFPFRRAGPENGYRQDSGQPPQASPAGRALCGSGFLSEGTAAGRIKGASPLPGVPDRAGDPQP